MYARSGLGLYPTDACYDPNRPSWLPYWFDSETESACFYGSGDLSAQVGAAAAHMAAPIGSTVGGLISGAVGGAAGGASQNIPGSLILIALAGLAVVVVLPLVLRR